jgi:hypothetical protein
VLTWNGTAWAPATPSGGGGGGSPGVAYWQGNVNTGYPLAAANHVYAAPFFINSAINYTHGLQFWIATADTNTADFYDIGIYGPFTNSSQANVPLVFHVGASNYTTTGSKSYSTSGTINPGWYLLALTGNATVANFTVGNANPPQWSRSVGTCDTGTLSSGGALPSTITACADNPGTSNNPQYFALW